ncbi:sensor histidine kinase [Pseudolysinimonas sp.]|uniref:sensor histidine kinase n=1 Tax=Pseudolysinimonas sp. TaxID=2680009 RepID=UPI003F8173D5
MSLGSAAGVDDDRRPLGRAFSVAGSIFVSAFVVREVVEERLEPWIAAVALVAVVSWLLASLLPSRLDRVRIPLWFVAVGAGSLVACATQVVGFVPALIGFASLIRRPGRPLAYAFAAGGLSLALLGAGALIAPQPVQLISSVAALLIAGLVAFSRRQYRASEQQERLLLAERLAVEQERAENAALAERSRIARDIHDVLAHSLGGLVLQLDAVEALLESGRDDEAARRVTAARGLAAEGLEEARRAVDALRDPEAAQDPGAAIRALVETHRSLGARAELHESGDPGPLDAAAAGALRRAAQEVLSNARRHAPGMPTELTLDWSPRDVAFRASTALAAGAPRASVGGGHGLTGLQERMTALGGSATAGVRGRAFVVEARIPRARGAQEEKETVSA